LSEPKRGAGTLYLVPVPLGETSPLASLPSATLEVVRGLGVFAVEHARSARRFLKLAGHPRPIQELECHLLGARSDGGAIELLVARLLAGTDCGLMSEAGCPAVADPGAALVRRAHAAGIRVEPLVGPSSILLALMASGMNGQRFAFHGYLPVDRVERARRLKEAESRAGDATQIFIETPYRNGALVQALLQHCRGDTLLCIAAGLTLPGALVATRTIAQWKRDPPSIDRRPAVFLLYRGR
jgi:16S rRNA (cytidine1402-2'-O)-methyltransferase